MSAHQLATVRTRNRSPIASDQRPSAAAADVLNEQHHRPLKSFPASFQGAAAPRLQGHIEEHVSHVHDLLDLTWHYQCVVSPSFSTGALAAALISKKYCEDCDPLTSNTRSSGASAAVATNSTDQMNPSTLKKLKLKKKVEDQSRDCTSDQFDLLRVRHVESLQQAAAGPGAPPASLRQAAEAVMPLLRGLQRSEGINYVDAGSAAASINSQIDKAIHEEDGYVSLASLLMRSPSDICCTSPTAADSHHHNYIVELALDLFNLRKQSSGGGTKSRSSSSSASARTTAISMFTSRTCRDNERRHSAAAAAPSTRFGASYAGWLAVD